MPPKSTKPTRIDATTHKDSRSNIPTEELRGFVAEDEKAPKPLRYLRDPSLDPQLVWRGKDEQDSTDLEVPAVPIYIQEKIHPRYLIEDLRTQTRNTDAQLELFADFNGIPFEKLIDFYHHPQHWTNRMILGDSLLVMASLAEKEQLRGQIQMIYLDPPYGIKFNSNWQVSTRKRDITDGKVEDLTRQPEQIKAFRDTWELGIHSYLAYLRDRIVIARDLLSNSGSIFVQISDENNHLVRCLLDEIFGSENFVAQIVYSKTTGATTVMLPGTADYIIWYCKDKEAAKYRDLYSSKVVGGVGGGKYDQVELANGTRRPLTIAERNDSTLLPQNARVYRLGDITSQSMGREKGEGAACWFPVKFEGGEFVPHIRRRWTTQEEGMSRLIAANRVASTGNTLSYVRFINDFPAYPITNVWDDIGGIQSRSDPKIYVVQTATEAIKRCMLMTTDPGDLVLDPTCGSGTTAYVSEQWGRRWITCDTSRVALALARTRIMAARFPYYLLADSLEGIKKEAELTGQLPSDLTIEGNIKKGFVYRRVPHITLKSITINSEIDMISVRWQEQLDILRSELNQLLLQHTWEEWQIPAQTDSAWSAPTQQVHTAWQSARQARQKEIDTSIARRADIELLYDQPYEDPKRVRVTGPFTVESLSPHRVLSTTEEDHPTSEIIGQQFASDRFESRIIENLKRAPVQTARKDERLKFDNLEPYPGSYLHAVGQYTDGEGVIRRAAVSIGPEYGTVSPEHIREAAKEAVLGIGFDLLIVCGFAFDPHVAEEGKRYGRLPVWITRINSDLMMGDELLKKTGAGNLFTVFGEPDVVLHDQSDDQIVVEIKGVDVYDPATGEIRSNSTDDIACWFIDTDYNGESFFVRHAYFTGAEDPYGNLKKALRAEIDSNAWASLYATISRSFARPKTGKIAIKVINHYGDEVLKVYETRPAKS